MNTIIQKVKATIQKYNMLQRHDKVLVGLSGGPDSVALVHLLNILKDEYPLVVYIAHLDHKIRAGESKADRKFCEELTRNLKLKIYCEERDIPKIVKETGKSSEEVARIERYNFFKETAGRLGIRKIAVGHTSDDQVETVLLRMLRGSGMLGLGGMSPIKEIKGFTVIRPLIEVSRKDIERFIKERKMKYRVDSSNEETVFTRNRVRHELLPLLEKRFNPNIKEVIANMAENLRTENSFLEKFSKRKFKSVATLKNGYITINLERFKRQAEAVKKRILRHALETLKGDLRRFSYQHWKEMEDLIKARPTNSVVDLPCGINIRKDKENLILRG